MKWPLFALPLLFATGPARANLPKQPPPKARSIVVQVQFVEVEPADEELLGWGWMVGPDEEEPGPPAEEDEPRVEQADPE